jgi:hypothetical protein
LPPSSRPGFSLFSAGGKIGAGEGIGPVTLFAQIHEEAFVFGYEMKSQRADDHQPVHLWGLLKDHADNVEAVV